MQIGDFNNNLSKQLKLIVDSGEPATVTWHRRNYVTVASTDLFDELIEAAGKRGQDVLRRHREASEQRKQEAAA